MTERSSSPSAPAWRVLVAEPIAQEGIDTLATAAEVVTAANLDQQGLLQQVAGFDALVVRSATQVTADVLRAGARLRVVARAGVGVDNIDVAAATQLGILVVNSAEGNTIAATEHTLGMLLALSRKIPAAAASMRAGEWKRGKFMGVEVYEKTLGVLGFGKIGREVSRRARALGMVVVAYDPFLGADQADRDGVELLSLQAVLNRADYLTLHLPLTRETKHLLGEEQLAQMKSGARIINCARGGILDEHALLKAIDSGHLAGAALDVFEQEPLPVDHPLRVHPLVVTTPHLGASTEEAQVNVAVDVAEQIVAVINGQPARCAVNVPAVSPDVYARLEPYLRLAGAIGKLHAQLAESPVRSVSIVCGADLLELDVRPITRAALVGLLQPVMAQPVNEVNSPMIAERRGIRVTESKTAGDPDAPTALRITVEREQGSCSIVGTVVGRREIRVREIDRHLIDVEPKGHLLVTLHDDRPGIIGSVGTLLGARGINIGAMYVGREAQGARAVMVLTVDDPVPESLREEIRQAIDAEYVRFVEL